ncbi:FAD-dependent oxidoreductase [Clostridium lacusfryxellense]|nr:FAD-dependent oxidoreductase [Clostridium lacusfryxellense]MBU3112588.1 FAD-dependent oxidoreductase [Clostridium lacusfryxellense]
MAVCLAMGEAAGIDADHSLKHMVVDVHAIDVQYLRARLIEEGAYLL